MEKQFRANFELCSEVEVFFSQTLNWITLPGLNSLKLVFWDPCLPGCKQRVTGKGSSYRINADDFFSISQILSLKAISIRNLHNNPVEFVCQLDF